MSGATIVAADSMTNFGVEEGRGAWSWLTIVDAEKMSRKDAVFIAKSYAAENDIPVIYECNQQFD